MPGGTLGWVKGHRPDAGGANRSAVPARRHGLSARRAPRTRGFAQTRIAPGRRKAAVAVIERGLGLLERRQTAVGVVGRAVSGGRGQAGRGGFADRAGDCAKITSAAPGFLGGAAAACRDRGRRDPCQGAWRFDPVADGVLDRCAQDGHPAPGPGHWDRLFARPGPQVQRAPEAGRGSDLGALAKPEGPPALRYRQRPKQQDTRTGRKPWN